AIAEHRIATGAEREDLANRVERLPHGRGTREGPEVAAPVLHDPAGDEHARPRVLHRHLDAHVALIVLQPDVVARAGLFDEVVLEDEGFLVVGGAQGLEVSKPLDQEADLASLVAAAEVATDPAAEVAGLADVDYLSVAVLQEVHTGTRGNRGEAVP